MNEGIKQYTLEVAYTDNTAITMYEKGKLVRQVVVADWRLDGYLERLIDEGYQRAYDVKIYERAVEAAKELLMQAELELEMARANKLYSEEELAE